MNYCVNCAWYKKQLLSVYPRCTLPGATPPDLVTGYTDYPLCYHARREGTKCGTEGKCWELKPTFWQMFKAVFKS